MSLRITILGCGSSGGVPRVGGDWGDCDPANPKNRRRRCSIMLEQSGRQGTTRVIDRHVAGSARADAVAQASRDIDGVWFTHEHADHTHGIDELRGFFLRMRRGCRSGPMQPTTAMLMSRFAYCFVSPEGSDYPAHPSAITP